MEFHKRTEKALKIIVSRVDLHCRFLSLLSHLETCGFRKIASLCRDYPSKMVLKHAQEEARHAFFLRRQMDKLSLNPVARPFLGSVRGKNYLNAIDLEITRSCLKTVSLRGRKLQEIVYPLVTLVVERRAMKLYPIYQSLLEQYDSPVNVKSIIAEEEEHLNEMEYMIQQQDIISFISPCMRIEKELFGQLLTSIEDEISDYAIEEFRA